MSLAHSSRVSNEPVIPEALINKFNVPGPRYTSYPTVPQWSGEFGEAHVERAIQEGQKQRPEAPIGLYFHLPFCRNRCSFCGCNVVVTQNQSVADKYLDYLEQEIELYRPLLGSRTQFGQLHLGGGTPTFLDESQLTRLCELIYKNFSATDDAEISLEIDPIVTTHDQLKLLRNYGFNRLSMGVQDFAPQVQAAIHRNQSFSETSQMVDTARNLGFRSINFDLIYGLPEQTQQSWHHTIEQVIDLAPDRLAMYGFAYLPEQRKHQKRLPIANIPQGPEKHRLFTNAYSQLLEVGYQAIGIDHFAHARDELSIAQRQKKLRRNFQGYSVNPPQDILAIGLTAISDFGGSFFQNVPQRKKYYDLLGEDRLPIQRGMTLSEQDLKRRKIINSLMCNFWADLGPQGGKEYAGELARLREFEEDGLLFLNQNQIALTPLGQFFVRNIAMVFDTYLGQKLQGFRYSQAV